MNLDLRYLGRSGVRDIPGGASLSFQPNLARSRVFFNAELVNPVRFREAISALHEVLVGDLRVPPKDRTAWQQWKAEEARGGATKEELERAAVPPALEADFRRMHALYWRARRAWAQELRQTDPELFRHLVPCDPVVTVAPDAVFFECFARDESSYGCLFVDREGFRGPGDAGLGTTNVDYSLALYEHFQTLRTYRPTRLLVDPTGFEVQVEGREDYREEKIDLPPSWLRGFGQLQAAMGLPTRRVELSVDVLYSALAHLRRHQDGTGPRSLQFQLQPGRPPSVVLEPWGMALASHGPAYQGERAEEIKVWGRRRLFALARALPLAEKVEVQLLGSGLPSIWTVHMGDMRLVLALSGWTANDWSSGADLALLSGAFQPDAGAAAVLLAHLRASHRATLAELSAVAGTPRDALIGSLHLLARQGQVLFDFATASYRYRQVMPVALSESLLGPEPPELIEGRRLFEEGRVAVWRDEPLPGNRRLLVAAAGEVACEGVLDADGGLSQAKCGCSHFFKLRLRGGPCRHLVALRLKGTAQTTGAPPGPPGWIH